MGTLSSFFRALPQDPTNSFAQMEVAINISISVAVLSVVKFYTALAKDLKHHKPLAKLLAFKLIIGLAFLEGVRLLSFLSFSPSFFLSLPDFPLLPRRLPDITY